MGARNRAGKKIFFLGPLFHALIGPVFVTRSGKPLRRTQVTGEIQSLAGTARVAPEKCNPRCLRKLYLTTQTEIERSVQLLAEQAYERMLDTEQLAAGWERIDHL